MTSTPAESILEPDLPICDAHHHLWERPPERYLLDEFRSDLGTGHNIVSTVAVECGYAYRAQGREHLRPVGETEFLEATAAQVSADSRSRTRIAAGIVGFADLSMGEPVEEVLGAHIAASPARFRGIRHSTTWDASGALRSEAPPGLLGDSTFRKGFARLGKLGLSFDAWVYHPQIHEVAELARAFPDTTIVLNHIGAPLGVGPYAGKRDEVFAVWRKGIAVIASCSNIVIKLGGVGSARSGYDWHEAKVKLTSAELADILTPCFERCIEQCGVERCMFESNFPVERRANSYAVIWNAFKKLTGSYSTSERAALFHDTACRVYRIAPRAAIE
jgi:predicted TIM-barrel fold metal-dependent hydrolase